MGESRVTSKGGVNGVRCPICGKPADDGARPFCSKRCADVDLARWMSGVYVIPASVDDDEDQGPSEIAGNTEGEGGAG